MRITTLRNKIFIFVVTTLVLGAGLVMAVTEKDVTRTVITNEDRSIDNVLTLLARDSVARWSSLLNQKVSTTRHAREPLIQYGKLVASGLDMYARQAGEKLISRKQAQALALQWVNQLDPGRQRRAYILDENLNVLADSRNQLIGIRVAHRQDIKGRSFSDIFRQELSANRPGFVVYRNPVSHGPVDSTELRYATFSLFSPWNWTVVISDSGQHMANQFKQQRTNMETALSETVASIRLAGGGFVFIMHNRHALTPLPTQYRTLLHASSGESTLADLLETTPPSGAVTRFEFKPPNIDTTAEQAPWIVKSAFVKPLKWTVVAVVPSDALARPATALRNRIGLLFLAGLAVSLGLAWLLAARITHPLHQLSMFARQLPERSLTHTEPLPLQIAQLPKRHHDEVGRLAAAFIHMDEQLRNNIALLLRETSRRERFESELAIARGIQVSLLPVELPEHITAQIDLHAIMLPAKEVGGDLYDYFMLPDGQLCFAIGDVSDKGMPAALFMAVTRTLVQACAEDETNPARLMERVNNRLAVNNLNMMFVTLIIGVLDLDDGTLHWANGGHPPPCIVRHDRTLRLLEGRSGPACGVLPDHRYSGFTTRLEPGEILFGYTDGIPEAMNSQNQQYGEERVHERLRKSGNQPAERYAAAVINDVHEFTQGNEQSDDITIIAIKRMRS